MGSAQYAKSCSLKAEKISGMIAIETIGYYCSEPGTQSYPSPEYKSRFPDTGNFLAFIGNSESKDLLLHSISTFRTATQFPAESMIMPQSVPGADWSDHLNFWKYGYPAIMLTDTALYRYPHYHKPQDDQSKLNGKLIIDEIDHADCSTV